MRKAIALSLWCIAGLFASAAVAQESAETRRLEELAAKGVASASELADSLLNDAKEQHSQGHLEESEALIRRTLAEFNKIPGAGIELQHRDVNKVVALTLLGDIQTRREDFAAAQATYLQQLGIARAQVAVQPSSFEWRSLLRISHHQLGDTQLALHQTVLAWQSYTSALEISRALLQINPDCWALQYEDSLAFIKLGEAQSALGAKASAERSFATASESLKSLASRIPTAADIHRDLLVVLVQQGDLLKDSSFYAQALTVAEDMQRRGLLAEADRWMIADLRTKTTPGSTAASAATTDYCGPVKQAVAESRTRFAAVRGAVLDRTDPTFFSTTLTPSWGKYCSISDMGVVSWSCEVMLGRGETPRSVFQRVDLPIAACLGSEWSPYRTGEEQYPAVVYSSPDVIVQVTAMPRSVNVSVSTHPPT